MEGATKRRGRPKMTWMEVVRKDTKKNAVPQEITLKDVFSLRKSREWKKKII